MNCYAYFETNGKVVRGNDKRRYRGEVPAIMRGARNIVYTACAAGGYYALYRIQHVTAGAQRYKRGYGKKIM